MLRTAVCHTDECLAPNLPVSPVSLVICACTFCMEFCMTCARLGVSFDTFCIIFCSSRMAYFRSFSLEPERSRMTLRSFTWLSMPFCTAELYMRKFASSFFSSEVSFFISASSAFVALVPFARMAFTRCVFCSILESVSDASRLYSLSTCTACFALQNTSTVATCFFAIVVFPVLFIQIYKEDCGRLVQHHT